MSCRLFFLFFLCFLLLPWLMISCAKKAEAGSADYYGSSSFRERSNGSAEPAAAGIQAAGFVSSAQRTLGLAYDDNSKPADSAGEAEQLSADAAAEKTRKLIRQATLHIQVADPEAAEQPVIAVMDKYRAYSSDTEIHENSRSYTIRVPDASFQLLLEELKGMGRVLYRSESAEDVTLKYYDLEGRLETKQELRRTFQKYLETAKTIQDIMAVETRLAELQNEIDWAGKELRSLSNLAEYATITLEIRGPASRDLYAKPGLGERIRGLFGSFGDYASGVLLILLGIIIYGIPGLGILVLLYWLLFGKIGLMKKVWRIASGKEKGKAP